MNYSNVILRPLLFCLLNLIFIGQAFSEKPSPRTTPVGTPAVMSDVTPQSYTTTQPLVQESAQTPATLNKTPHRQPDRIQVIGDTITFEEYDTGTVITDQYLQYGVVFSGLEPGQDPVIYDYGPASITRIIHSYDWYGALVAHFVNPLNPEVYRPVRRISFDNAASSDYITIHIYDSQDNLIYSKTSFGQEHIDIRLADYQAAYMVLDDSLETAYAVDNIYFDYQPEEDMITFSEYENGTVITDQYTNFGVLFRGVVEGQNPIVQEYGDPILGRVLRSFDWFGPIVAEFVNPENPENPQPVRRISLDNPIETEIDYVNVKVYDIQDNLLYNYTSKSPDRIHIDLGKAIGAYMVIDDSLGTAYIIDNIKTDTLGVVSDIADNSSLHSLPLDFQLEQNYPNPFNPSTTINYKLNKMNVIDLSIYNTLGQKVATLVSGRQAAGSYSVEWNAAGFSSGIYYYRLKTTSGPVQTKKLIIMK